MCVTAGTRTRLASLTNVVIDMKGEMLLSLPSGIFSNHSAACSDSTDGARGRYLHTNIQKYKFDTIEEVVIVLY